MVERSGFIDKRHADGILHQCVSRHALLLCRNCCVLFVSVVNPCVPSCPPILPYRVLCGAVFVTYAMPAIPTASAVRSCIHCCIAVVYNLFLPVPSFLLV